MEAVGAMCEQETMKFTEDPVSHAEIKPTSQQQGLAAFVFAGHLN